MITKKDKNKLQPEYFLYRLKPEVKTLIRTNKALMRAIEDNRDISEIRLYQWIQKDYRGLFHPDTLCIIEAHLKMERTQFLMPYTKET